MTQSTLIIVLAIAFVAVAAIALLAYQRWNTRQLKSRFGAEYDRTVGTHDNQVEAEAELREREKRAKQLQIRPVTPTDKARFVDSWRSIQARFVDDPGNAVTQADQLLGEVMTVRGYPIGGYEQRSADVSVDHPDMVQHYHAAHEVAVQREKGLANTEDLRTAMISYRAIFDDLVGDSGADSGAARVAVSIPAVH